MDLSQGDGMGRRAALPAMSKGGSSKLLSALTRLLRRKDAAGAGYQDMS